MTAGGAELRCAGQPGLLSPHALSQGFGRGWFRVGQQGPGFAVFFVAACALAVLCWIEREAGAGDERFDGDDVPGVVGDDVGYEEVDLFGGVGDVAFGGPVGVDDVSAIMDAAGGFDLDAPEVLAGIEDEVVATAVADRLGNSESELYGFEGEGDLG